MAPPDVPIVPAHLPNAEYTHVHLQPTRLHPLLLTNMASSIASIPAVSRTTAGFLLDATPLVRLRWFFRLVAGCFFLYCFSTRMRTYGSVASIRVANTARTSAKTKAD